MYMLFTIFYYIKCAISDLQLTILTFNELISLEKDETVHFNQMTWKSQCHSTMLPQMEMHIKIHTNDTCLIINMP